MAIFILLPNESRINSPVRNQKKDTVEPLLSTYIIKQNTQQTPTHLRAHIAFLKHLSIYLDFPQNCVCFSFFLLYREKMGSNASQLEGDGKVVRNAMNKSAQSETTQTRRTSTSSSEKSTTHKQQPTTDLDSHESQYSARFKKIRGKLMATKKSSKNLKASDFDRKTYDILNNIRTHYFYQV
jgi:hypothetical protein